MKHLYLFLTFLLFSTLALSQTVSTASDNVSGAQYTISEPTFVRSVLDAGQWSLPNTYPDLPAATYFQESAWLGDTLYVHAPGTTATATTTILKYYPGGSTWITGNPLPVALVGGSLTKCGTKLYYIGGSTTGISGTALNTVYEYTPSNGQWVSKATAPATFAAHGAVCWGDSVIFVIGGPYSGAATNLNVYFYRPASNTWGSILNSLPTGAGRRTFGLGISGNKIVMAGGYNSAFLKDVLIGVIGANASMLTWHSGPVIPTQYTGLSRPGAVGIGPYFYLVNGERAGLGGYYDTTHIMNVNSEQWIDIVNNKPIKMSNICNAVAARTFGDTVKVFVPGGYGSATGLTPGVGVVNFDVISRGNLLLVPVELINFSGTTNASNVHLNWSTASERNNLGYEIHRSYNNGSYINIGFVNGKGTSSEISNYSFVDQNLLSGNYKYLLVQIDLDGSRSYSKVVDVNMDYIPDNFSVKQNYPNPFNPSTKIDYQISVKSNVSLAIYNSLGQEINSINYGEQEPGIHSITFTASDLVSGVYFYKISAGNFSSLKKMIVLK